eukprot:631826-Prorocentrum_minimum.AAC.2
MVARRVDPVLLPGLRGAHSHHRKPRARHDLGLQHRGDHGHRAGPGVPRAHGKNTAHDVMYYII